MNGPGYTREHVCVCVCETGQKKMVADTQVVKKEGEAGENWKTDTTYKIKVFGFLPLWERLPLLSL